jgi:hypothetical protein
MCGFASLGGAISSESSVDVIALPEFDGFRRAKSARRLPLIPLVNT